MSSQSNQNDLMREQFSADLLRNERFRFWILVSVLVILFLVVIMIMINYYQELSIVFKKTPTFDWILVLIIALIVRSLSIQYYLSRRSKKNKPLYPFQQYINSFIEVSVPSAAIIIFAQQLESVHALITPAPFLYFIFILLSTLEMDLKLSVFTGAIAAIQYLIIALYYLDNVIQPADLNVIYFPGPYIAKAIILLLSGIIAGLITQNLKARVIQGYQLQAERNRLENLFGQQVSAEIVNELLKNQSELASKKRFVCILFLDIRGFTKYCQNRSPEEIVKYQNDIFSFMIEIISEHKGIINQFLGDGFMATFGAPVTTGNECAGAVEAAQKIYTEVNQRSEDGHIAPTEIGIGIHAGEAVTGNVGTTTRKQYSITGNVVILAARLEQLNKELKSHILISKEVLDRMAPKTIAYEEMGLVSIKGRDEPVEVFKLA